MILPDWFWRAFGHRVVTPFDPQYINPVSFDLTLANTIRLQRYRGVEYDNTPAVVYTNPSSTGDRPELMLRDHKFADGSHVSTMPFQPGDSVLASSEQRLTVPRWIRLQGMLKSSTARAGLNHRTALYIDPGFHGYLTLELVFDRSGYLVPRKPIIQVEAALAFPGRTYRGHYQDQGLSTPNRNLHNLGFRPALDSMGDAKR